MVSEIISVKNLKKSYKGNKVIKGISFGVNKGEILCFLGPNGAGKSTTINILTGALGYEVGEAPMFQWLRLNLTLLISTANFR